MRDKGHRDNSKYGKEQFSRSISTVHVVGRNFRRMQSTALDLLVNSAGSLFSGFIGKNNSGGKIVANEILSDERFTFLE